MCGYYYHRSGYIVCEVIFCAVPISMNCYKIGAPLFLRSGENRHRIVYCRRQPNAREIVRRNLLHSND